MVDLLTVELALLRHRRDGLAQIGLRRTRRIEEYGRESVVDRAPLRSLWSLLYSQAARSETA